MCTKKEAGEENSRKRELEGGRERERERIRKLKEVGEK